VDYPLPPIHYGYYVIETNFTHVVTLLAPPGGWMGGFTKGVTSSSEVSVQKPVYDQRLDVTTLLITVKPTNLAQIYKSIRPDCKSDEKLTQINFQLPPLSETIRLTFPGKTPFLAESSSSNEHAVKLVLAKFACIST
jgi:hypothetical protein